MSYFVLLFLSLITLYIFYKWSVANYDILSKRGIPHEKPWPLFGNFKFELFFGKATVVHLILEEYNKYKNCKIFGSYSFRDYVIHIHDLDLIKKVAIKNFEHFPNHKTSFDKFEEEIISKSLIVLRNEKWRKMRSILSPAFTGSKMRLMFELVNECCIEGINFMNKELKSSGNEALEMEMSDYFTRFTNDAIASTAFGIKVNSFLNKDNEFYTFGSSLLAFNGLIIIKAILFEVVPKLMKALRVKLFQGKKMDYFSALVYDAIKFRRDRNIIRPDMIHLLMEAKRQHDETGGDHADFTDEDLLAQCLLFFVAGFQTVSTCLCFTTHELLDNPDVQEKLYKEIIDMEEELGGKPLSFDDIMRMKYLDMVVSESLRKWPPSLFLDRICVSDSYKLKDEEDKTLFELKKGDALFIPIFGIHRDSKYFENPDQFDPERFSDENKSSIKPMSYIPFGVGPRSCIGNRLALMETKILLYHILLRFKIGRAEKTSENLMDSMHKFLLMPKELFWMKFIPRNK